MLVPYSATIFFPGGNRAAGADVGVALDGSNQPPMIFTDNAGLFPAPNPMTADGVGFITFYAAPGYYLSMLAGTANRIPVDPGYGPPVWADLYIHTQSVPSSVWTVNHFFGTNPSVSVDLGTLQVEPQIDHPSPTQTVITFSSPQAGIANLRR